MIDARYTDEIARQFKALADRVLALERLLRKRQDGAGVPFTALTFADLPASPRTGEAYFVTDRAVGGGSAAGLIAVWNGSVWVGPDGNAVV